MKRKVVKFIDPGAKVVRGPDWEWGNQDKGSVYGIIDPRHKGLTGWVNVSWIDKDNKWLNSANYRVREDGDPVYDLCYYDRYEDEVFIYDTVLEKTDKPFKSYNINLIITKIN